MAKPPENPGGFDRLPVVPSVFSHAPLSPLPPHGPQVSYDAELERLIRVAAAAEWNLTRSDTGAVNYETLVIGFAFGQDAASRFVREKRRFRLEPLLASRRLSLTSDDEGTLQRQAHTTQLPSPEVLYSSSAWQMLDLAAEIRQLVAENGAGPLGPRHLLAAFLHRNPAERAEDLRRCGVGSWWFPWSFLWFAQREWKEEHWQALYPRPLRSLPWPRRPLWR